MPKLHDCKFNKYVLSSDDEEFEREKELKRRVKSQLKRLAKKQKPYYEDDDSFIESDSETTESASSESSCDEFEIETPTSSQMEYIKQMSKLIKKMSIDDKDSLIYKKLNTAFLILFFYPTYVECYLYFSCLLKYFEKFLGKPNIELLHEQYDDLLNCIDVLHKKFKKYSISREIFEEQCKCIEESERKESEDESFTDDVLLETIKKKLSSENGHKLSDSLAKLLEKNE